MIVGKVQQRAGHVTARFAHVAVNLSKFNLKTREVYRGVCRQSIVSCLCWWMIVGCIPHVRRYVYHRGLYTKMSVHNRQLRYTERILQSGTEILHARCKRWMLDIILVPKCRACSEILGFDLYLPYKRNQEIKQTSANLQTKLDKQNHMIYAYTASPKNRRCGPSPR